MPEIITELHLVVTEYPFPPEYISEQWAEGLKINAGRINQKRKLVIGNPQDFETKLAGSAKLGWKDVINPAFKSKSGLGAEQIKDAFGSNLTRSYDKWNSGLEYAFETVDEEEAKRFKEKVDNAKDTFAVGMANRTLRMTGDKINGRGASPIASMWLTGDLIAKSLLRPGDDLIKGEPVDISKSGMRSTLKAALTQRITQSGIVVIRSGYNATTITDENTNLCATATALADNLVYEDFAEPIVITKSHLGFEVVNNTLYLVVQVYKK
ncbi:MAG: hypothetical protein V1871_02715 [Planctomycetota bacterium]